MPLRGLIRIGLLLMVALVVGLMLRGMFIASNQQPPPPKVVATVGVCTAGQALPAGWLLKEDDFVWKDVPEDQVVPTMIVRQSRTAAKLVGAVVRRPIGEGTTITERDVVFADAPGFLAAALTPGLRAVSVAIDDVTGNAGLILPGDRVDLLLTLNLEASADGRSERQVASETALSDLRVIAVGSSMKAPESEGASSSVRAARTVTLEVTPEDAEKITVATRLGQLSLALRSLASPRPAAASDPAEGGLDGGSEEKGAAKPTWGEDVSMAIRLREGAHKGKPAGQEGPAQTVQVFRGSQKDTGHTPIAAPGAAAAPDGLPPGFSAQMGESLLPDLRHAR